MEPVTVQMIEALQANPVAPSDYIAWLEQCGWGELRTGTYALYSGLISLKEISPDAPNGFWTFGDDFAGYNGCFSETRDGIVYEWDSSNGEIITTGKNFLSYISRWASAP